MRIKNERIKLKTANQKLRRSRRLYVRFCASAINEFGNDAIDRMQIKSQERGLYSQGTDKRSIRQSIQSHLFRIEKPKGKYGFGVDNWYEWLFEKGMDAYTGYFNAAKEMRA